MLAAGPGSAEDASSDIRRVGEAYGFAPDIIWAGTGYLKRLSKAAFVINSGSLTGSALCPSGTTVGGEHMSWLTPEAWLTLIHLTCIYLAAKYLDFVPYCDMLHTMMSHVYDVSIDKKWVTQLELDCLTGLQWDLSIKGQYEVAQCRL